jgi:putative ubiquitin-RnfH superfamily antitoxin RatB of RatAB toxin-antitoxin module
MIPVEIAYGLKNQQVIIPIAVAIGSTVEHAIVQSGMLARFPDLDLLRNKVGIFGQVVALSQPLNAGDRVEIYRPLNMDPKQARLLRARKAKKGGATSAAAHYTSV